MPIHKILTILQRGGKGQAGELEGLVAAMAYFLKSETLQHPDSYSPRQLRYKLQRKGLSTVGTFQQLVIRYTQIPESGKQ